MAKGIKTVGLTPGVVNKTTAEIRERFQNLVSENLEQLNDYLKSLETIQRLKMIIELSKFVVPNLKATELTTGTDNGFQPIILNLGNGISPEQVKTINAELEAKY